MQVEKALVMIPRDDSRLYPIRPEPSYLFDTGITDDDRQVFMGLTDGWQIALFFDRAGNFLNVETRDAIMTSEPENGDGWIACHLEKWQTEIGFQQATIQVKRFFHRRNQGWTHRLPRPFRRNPRRPRHEPRRAS